MGDLYHDGRVVGGNSSIDDSDVDLHKTWSSKKVSDEIDARIAENKTVAGLTPIFVSKRVTFPANSLTSVDLSEFIPQGKSIRAIGTVKVNNYPLPYFGGNNLPTFVREINGNTLVFDNRVSDWQDNLLTAIIYI